MQVLTRHEEPNIILWISEHEHRSRGFFGLYLARGDMHEHGAHAAVIHPEESPPSTIPNFQSLSGMC